eukprot:Anaeramoba_flamelloidesa1054070_64.p1 GENE.a1054070_64~~a1054070_64.p1  ORF type:complete len:408 (-),score=72.12 a1054070_64:52-1275(-)
MFSLLNQSPTFTLTNQNHFRNFSNKAYDAIIVGAGSIGVPTSFKLQESGLKVLVIDQKASPGQGDNKCAIGGIRATHGNDSKILACIRSLEVFSTWEEKHGHNIEWLKGGYSFPCYREKEENDLKSLLPLQQGYGMKIDYISAQDIQELIPGINPKGLRGGTWSPDDGSASPMLSSFAFYKYAKELGVDFKFKEKVIRILKNENNKVVGVKTVKDTYSAPIVIDAAGSWSPQLMSTVGINIDLVPDSHEAAITEPTEKFFTPMVVDLRPGKGSKNVYFYQNGLGQLILCITPDPPIKGTNRQETSSFLPMISKRVISLLPRLKNVRYRRTWRGVYPMTPDGAPIMGWNKELKGLYMATGMCGQGFMCGPGLAETIEHDINGNLNKDDKIILEFTNPYREYKGMEKIK